MKLFAIYQHPERQDVEAIKQGWSWPGCLFTFIWSVAQKLWGVAAIVGGLHSVIYTTSMILYSEGSVFGGYLLWAWVIGIMILIGARGNQWREKRLLKRGYACRATIIARTPSEAVILYFHTPEGEAHESVRDLSTRR